MVGDLAVQHVGGVAANRTAEHLGKWVDCQRVGLLRLQCASGGDK